MQHRDIGDLMRYAALNQNGDFLAKHGDFMPQEAFGPIPQDPAQYEFGRYSDEQLYALALYVYSLQPPPNPNKFDALAARGQKIFERKGCTGCHTPPLYSNNKLTPACSFKMPEGHNKKFGVKDVCVNTNSDLALKTRRGTGYYKVPSLRNVWARGPLEHSGSVATLEDWFDPNRVDDDYVPTGFRGHGVKTRAVEGHLFGLELSDEDRKALIAFLKTL
ncbi:MAG: c-type cytochrome [bacterium]